MSSQSSALLSEPTSLAISNHSEKPATASSDAGRQIEALVAGLQAQIDTTQRELLTRFDAFFHGIDKLERDIMRSLDQPLATAKGPIPTVMPEADNRQNHQGDVILAPVDQDDACVTPTVSDSSPSQ